MAEFISAPRRACEVYVANNGGKALLLSKEDFDKCFKQNHFKHGPYQENSSAPCLQAYGTLKNGFVVYCELNPVADEHAIQELKTAKQLSQTRAEALIGCVLEDLLDQDILTPCTIEVERNGRKYFERGYKASNDCTLQELVRLALGAESIKLKE